MKRFRTIILSVAVCIFVSAGVVLSLNGYFVNLVRDFEGYDFGPILASDYDWIGPKPGEKIDIDSLIDSNGTTLRKMDRSDLILLTVVDPECAATAATQAQLRFLQDNLVKASIDYRIMTISTKPTDEDLLKYTNFIGLIAQPLRWSKSRETAPASLQRIVIPSHVLIDSDGTVIETFPGTSTDRRVRDRMVREVLRQVLAEAQRRK